MKPRKLRRAGAKWRLLVHRNIGQGPKSDLAYHVQSDAIPGRDDSEHSKAVVLPHTEFDELVVGSWIHIEQMNTGTWWMNVAGVVIWVTVDRDGRPVRLSGYTPGVDSDPVLGCRYLWDEEPIDPQPIVLPPNPREPGV